MKRRRVAAVLVLMMVSGVAFSGSARLWGQPPSTGPASGIADAIKRDLQLVANELRAVLAGPDSLLDPVRRNEVAPNAIPPLRRMIDLLGQLEQLDAANAEQLREARMQYQVLAAAYGDADSRGQLEIVATGSDPQQAPVAQAALLLVQWLGSNRNADSQTQILDRAQALAAEHPRNNSISQIVAAMADMAPADPKLAHRALSIAASMDNPNAGAFKMRLEAKAKLKALEDQPMRINGTTIDGRPFNSEQLTGKVVLVDFWATWCGPCLADLPRLKRLYQTYRPKGLEIVGVSNDYRIEDLKQFLAQDAEVSWVQLFDEKAARAGEWNSLTIGFAVDRIPTMFLIDKKGICRTTDAREHLEQLIPKMLAE